MSLPFLPPDFLDDWGWAHVKPPVLRRGRIVAARAEDLYPELSDVRLTIMDGPYGKGKADWDRVKDLRAWYAPHIEGVSRCSAASASAYFWNTPGGWAEVHPLWLAAGWTFVELIVWVKPLRDLRKTLNYATIRRYPDIIEVCGFYRRSAVRGDEGSGSAVTHAVGKDARNWIRPWLRAEWDAAGLSLGDADAALGTHGMAGHYFGASQWELPTWERYEALARTAQDHGPARERPYFVRLDARPPDLAGTYAQLKDAYQALLDDYDGLRAQHEGRRPYFTCEPGLSNVWEHPAPKKGRLRDAHGKPLHPCQKPLLFAERMIRASSRPGELVFEPFGGTCRAAVACELFPEVEARRYVCVEPNENYIAGAVADIERRRAAA